MCRGVLMKLIAESFARSRNHGLTGRSDISNHGIRLKERSHFRKNGFHRLHGNGADNDVRIFDSLFHRSRHGICCAFIQSLLQSCRIVSESNHFVDNPGSFPAERHRSADEAAADHCHFHADVSSNLANASFRTSRKRSFCSGVPTDTRIHSGKS